MPVTRAPRRAIHARDVARAATQLDGVETGQVVGEHPDPRLGDAEQAPGLLAGRPRPLALARGDVFVSEPVPGRAVGRHVLRQALGVGGVLLDHLSRRLGASPGRRPGRPPSARRRAAGPPARGPRRGRARRRAPAPPRPRPLGEQRPPRAARRRTDLAVDRQPHRHLQRRRVPPLRLARGEQVRAPLLEPLVREAEPGRVPRVRVAGCQPQHAFALGGDEDRRSSRYSGGAGRGRDQHRVLDVVPAAVEGDPLAVEEWPDDRQRLLEPARPVVEGVAERGVLRLVPAGAEAQDQASVRHLVQRRRHLGQERRRPEARPQHDRAQLHALRDRGGGREQRPGLVDAVLGLIRQPEDEVVVDPEAVEAALLGVAREGPDA